MTKSQVLAELEVTLAQKERAVALNASDNVGSNQVQVLYQVNTRLNFFIERVLTYVRITQLRRLVEQGVSQEELSQILQQLRAMGHETGPPLPLPQAIPPPPAQPQIYGYQAPLPNAYGAPSAYMQPTAPVPGPPPVYGQASVPSTSSTPVLAHATPAVAPPSAITDLFKNLVKAGLVSARGSGANTPVQGSSASFEVPTTEREQGVNEKEAEKESLDARKRYATKVLGMKVKLTSGDIMKFVVF